MTIPYQVRKYCTQRNIIYGVIGAILITIIITVCVILLPRPSHSNEERMCTNSLAQSNVRNLNLSNTDLISSWLDSSTWQICQYLYGQQLTSLVHDLNHGPVLEVKYPNGSANPSGSLVGGIHFYAQPSVFPSNEMCLSYQIKFHSNFTWVKGGKLPGLWIGETGANGGDHKNDGSSFRPMWRADGDAEAYLYVPKQMKSYYKLDGAQVNNEGNDGDSVWRGEFKFKLNTWTPIKMYVKLNTFDPTNHTANNDGILQMSIGTKTRNYSQMKWIRNNHLISGLMMQSFFGGGDPSWRTPNDTWISMTYFSFSHDKFLCD